MRCHAERLFSINAIAFLTALASAASAATVLIDGSASIFGAGHATPPAPASGGAGTLPPPRLISEEGRFILSALAQFVTEADFPDVECRFQC